MDIRPARIEDLPRLMDIYRQAREIMLSCGDVNQWKPGHPSEEMIRDDIAHGYCHLVVSDGLIVGAFAFIPGKAGFKYCGIIHLLNGDPRLAYQKIDKNKKLL